MVEKFSTTRLTVHEVLANAAVSDRNTLLSRVLEIFTPDVVKHLPPSFHSVDSMQAAELWFADLMSQSRMFIVSEKLSQSIIGLLFVHVDARNQANIGYLLAEDYWGKGLASELLTGFIEFAGSNTPWTSLLGGVGKHNTASAHLLKKLGFVETADKSSAVSYYRYDLRQAGKS